MLDGLIGIVWMSMTKVRCVLDGCVSFLLAGTVLGVGTTA
jgi:hypothetical protein